MDEADESAGVGRKDVFCVTTTRRRFLRAGWGNAVLFIVPIWGTFALSLWYERYVPIWGLILILATIVLGVALAYRSSLARIAIEDGRLCLLRSADELRIPLQAVRRVTLRRFPLWNMVVGRVVHDGGSAVFTFSDMFASDAVGDVAVEMIRKGLEQEGVPVRRR